VSAKAEADVDGFDLFVVFCFKFKVSSFGFQVLGFKFQVSCYGFLEHRLKEFWEL
jgi:hypothetical protein